MRTSASSLPLSLAGKPRRLGRPVDWPAAALVTLLLGVCVAWALASGPVGLGSLPAVERSALLERTVSDLDRFCGPERPAALDDHCRELAAFAARLDACRGHCAELVHRTLTPRPTR